MRAAVFGTDPMAPPPPAEPTITAPNDPGAAIRKLAPHKAAERKILYENAKKLFRM